MRAPNTEQTNVQIIQIQLNLFIQMSLRAFASKKHIRWHIVDLPRTRTYGRESVIINASR